MSPGPQTRAETGPSGLRHASPLLASLLAFFVVSSALAGPNETPKKRTAIIFGPHPTAQGLDKSIEEYLCAENYAVTKYVWGRGGGDATLDRLRTIAASGFGVLVIIAHGTEEDFTVEDFRNGDAAKAKFDQYRANPDFNNLKDDLGYGLVDDITEGQNAKRGAISLNAKGLSKLFGAADPNRSIVAVFACDSWQLQANHNPKPFGATEYIGLDGTVKGDRSKAALGFYVMGGIYGIPRRPVKPAFEKQSPAKHQGPGNTTLAPASTDHLPANDAVLPLNQTTDGKTTYETTMNTSNAAIMEVAGCEAVLSAQAWTDDCNHSFKVEPKKKGRMILKVRPKAAISKNNDNWLIGNLYVAEPDDWDPRREINDCPFGQSGLDGRKPCVPPENPFRWCVWCAEKPPDPGIPYAPSKPPQKMDDPNSPRQVPFGERDAFVLYQDAPGPNTVITSSTLPPNLSFQQNGTWYGSVVFSPVASQALQSFSVLFSSSDDSGPRNHRTLTWKVVPRYNALCAATIGTRAPGLASWVPESPGSAEARSPYRMDDPPENPGGQIPCVIFPEIVRPGETAEYLVAVHNTGNTVIRSIALALPGLMGPQSIPPSAISIVPNLIGLLSPGEAAACTLRVQTQAAQKSGHYSNDLQVSGTANDGSVLFRQDVSLQVNRPPVISAPDDTITVLAGQHVSIPIAVVDPDSGLVSTSIDYAPFGGLLLPDLTFDWTPPAEAVGHRVFSIVAYDGWEPTVHELRFDVDTIAAGSRRAEAFGPSSAAVISSVGNRPNPFRLLTRLQFTLARSADVVLEVFDVNGRVVSSRSLGRLAAGVQEAAVGLAGAKSGIYLYRLLAKNPETGASLEAITGKMVHLR